jgi:hypothetical protein
MNEIGAKRINIMLLYSFNGRRVCHTWPICVTREITIDENKSIPHHLLYMGTYEANDTNFAYLSSLYNSLRVTE